MPFYETQFSLFSWLSPKVTTRLVLRLVVRRFMKRAPENYIDLFLNSEKSVEVLLNNIYAYKNYLSFSLHFFSLYNSS